MLALTPAQLLLALEKDLKPWGLSNKVSISIASDPFEVIELLAEGPATSRVILLWKGDQNTYESGFDLGVVRNDIEVTLSHNRGLAIQPGQSLLKSNPSRPSLVALLVALRSRLRSLRLQEDGLSSVCFEYQGSDPVVTPEGLRLDAYTLRFQIFTALDSAPERLASLPSITTP